MKLDLIALYAILTYLLTKRIVIQKVNYTVKPDLDKVIEVDASILREDESSSKKPKITKLGFASVYTSRRKPERKLEIAEYLGTHSILEPIRWKMLSSLTSLIKISNHIKF